MLALGLASVIFLIKSLKLSLAYLSLVFTFILSLFLINATMYGVNFDLFTLQQLQLLDEAQAVFNFDFLSIPSIITGTIVLLVFIAVNIVLITIIKKRPKITNYYRNALVAFAFIALVLVGYFTSETPLMKRYNEIENITAFKRANLESYGLLGYYFKESQNIIALSHFIDDSEPEPTATIPIEPLVTTEPKVPIETTKSTKTTGPLLVFEKSPFFGLLEGKNIITIMLESGQSFAVNEHLTPNLYRLTREGLYFANNYSENKTNQSEMIAIAGNYPSVNFSPSLYDYDFSFSLAELLNDTYNTYFHDNEPSFTVAAI